MTGPLGGLNAAGPAVAMVAAFALVFFGGRMAWQGHDRRRGVLMLVAALVLVGNVLVWTM